MPRPMPLESSLSQVRLVSDSGVLGVGRSGKKGFLSPEKGLLSRIEVGLMTASAVSEKFLKVKPVNNLGKELGFLYLFVGDRIVLKSAIRACLLLVTLDLFLIITQNTIFPLQKEQNQIKKTS